MPRDKIVVAAPFPIYPPIGGGKLRVFHLYRYLSRFFDIHIVSLTTSGKPVYCEEVHPWLWETKVNKTKEHFEKEADLNKRMGCSSSLVCLPELYKLTPAYVEELRNICQDAVAIIACHPFLYPAIREATNKPIWYEAQDMEYDLHYKMIPQGENREIILEGIKQIEELCIKDSELIVVCNDQDKSRFIEMYDAPAHLIIEVPNGADLEGIEYIFPSDKPKGNIKAVFVGSGHPPNLIAAQEIIKFAIEMPEVQFIVIGSCGSGIKSYPPNVKLTQMIDDDEKNSILSTADIALNPIPYGTGTNLKMFEYFAFGIPVISTRIGVRGMNIVNNEHALIVDINEFPKAIKKMHDSIQLRTRISMEARRWVIAYGWSSIAERWSEEISKRGLAKPQYQDKLFIKRIGQNDSEEILKRESVNKDVYIWGAGSAGENTYLLLEKKAVVLSGFIDSSSQKIGQDLKGIPIFGPEEMSNWNSPFIIISSTYASEIKEHLKALGKKEYKDYVEQNIHVPYLLFE